MGLDHGFHPEHLLVATLERGDETSFIYGFAGVLAELGGLHGVVEGWEVEARELGQVSSCGLHGFGFGFRAP